MTACPCGTGNAYDDCCGRWHAGAPAPTAEALMRSRYSAFALGRFDYLAATQTGPFGRDTVLAWVGLTIHDATSNEVEFTARYVDGEKEVSVFERSRFEQQGGRWLYLTGKPTVTSRKLSRNDPCPCGSGKKLKACHAA